MEQTTSHERLIIAGTRTFADVELLQSRMAARPLPAVVLCGMAPGADLLGKGWAESLGVPVEEYPAEWELYGRKAGFIRNREMAKHATHLIAFWNGQSNGTRHMIKIARDFRLPTEVVRY